MAQRRLANGRFARVIELPSPKRRFKKAEGGVIIVRTNAAAAARDLGVRRLSVQPNLLDAAQQRALNIQEKMQGAALAEYARTGTGRFARGIRAQVSASVRGDVSETVIRVTAFNYRETRFLTNIGGQGYFKRYPVGPYPIWAKGARGLAMETPIGVDVNTKSNLLRVQRHAGVGRLKVPARGRGVFLTSARGPGRGGGESRIVNDRLGPSDSLPGEQNAFFYYPIRVTHPGFHRDIISDIAREEGAKFVVEARGVVGTSLGGEGLGFDTNDMVVSEEIPITQLRVITSRSSTIRSFR